MNEWNLYNTPPLLSSLLLLFWGIIVLSKNSKSKLALTFFLICVSTFFWQFSFFILFSNFKFNIFGFDIFIFFSKLCYIGIIFVPVFFLNFTLLFTEKIKQKSNKFFLLLLYFVTLLFEFLLIKTNLVISGVYVYKFGRYPMAGLLNPSFYFFVFIMTAYVVYLLLSFQKEVRQSGKLQSKVKLLQIKSFLIATLFYVFSSIDALGNYGVSFYPAGYFFILSFLFIIGYSIISYRLMDIKFVLRSSSVYLSSLALTLIPAIFLKYLFDSFFPQYSYWIDSLIVIFSISVFPLFKERIYRFANKYLFSSLYDTKTVIKELSNKLGSTLETGTIYQTVTDSLTGALHMKALSFLTCGVKSKDVQILFNSGLKVPAGLKSELACKVIFGTYAGLGKMVLLDELRNKTGKQDKAITKVLTEAGVEILVPLIVNDKSVGIIALGPKESGDTYNNEDLDLLKIVGTQTAISLENALLYEETKKFNVKLTKEVERATHELKQANEELKTLDQAKSDFISIASHQLRTPLTVIKGYGSMMLEGSFGKMPAPIEDNMRKIYDSNERLINLVEDLLNVSRIESGRLQFNWEVGQLEEMVTSVVEELTPNATKKGLTFKYQAPTKSFPSIKLDKTKLRQVAINLIDNAIKYTEKGGLTVTLTKEADKLKFCVSDTGTGIKPEGMSSLFKKFSRGEKTSVLHTEGTGLGLYVGKMMVEAHGGRIWAESDGEGKGSRFCFELPLATSIGTAKVEINTPPTPLKLRGTSRPTDALLSSPKAIAGHGLKRGIDSPLKRSTR